jgi:cellulose synthase/poly-beta-1,6-N-acetylglucosamine synthase-like glycosyltransferase
MLVSLWELRRPAPPAVPARRLPKVSVIVPAYNEQLNINHCIMSLKAQTYPHRLIEIIVVDDGSQDRTGDMVLGHMGNGNGDRTYLRTSSFTIAPQGFGGVLNLVRRKRDSLTSHGKPAAVNAGLALATGDLIIAIDSDVVLEPTAIEHAVRVFAANDRLVAATGHLIIDPYLVAKTNETGGACVDENGLPINKPLTFNESLLTACQFLEYATVFHLGRRAESLTDSMFTLSGACAVYRREAFATNGGYRGRTVSEDTDMTMMLHRMPGKQVGYLPQMRVHLAPVLKWSTLYAQRTRWRRGELEVSAVHLINRHHQAAKRLFWKVLLPLRLQGDHTLSLPRIMWMFLIFMLPLFGYAWSLVLEAAGLLFVFYSLVNVLRILVAYLFSSPPEKVFIRRYLGHVCLLPLYNMFLFWTHVSADIRTLTEEATWTVHNPFLKKLETANPRALILHTALLFRNFF